MRRKLAAVAVAALAPVVAMLGYNEFSMRQQRNEEIRTSAAQAARQASSEVERIVEGLHSLLIAVAAIPSVQELDPSACTTALKSIAANVANIRTIFIVDLQGNFVCGSQAAPPGVQFSDRDYFRQALSSKDFVVGTFTKSRISNSPVLPVAMPLLRDGTPVGVVTTGVRLEWLQARIADRGVTAGNAITIADSTGTILARVPLPERFVGTVIPVDFQRYVHSTSPGVIDVKSQDGTERILGYRPINPPHNPLYVSAGFSKAEAFALINRASIINTASIIGGAVLAFLAAVLIGRWFILAPITRIAETMEEWRAGNTCARTNMIAKRDELSQVGETLDRLLDELGVRRERAEQAEEERSLLARELSHRIKNSFALLQVMARKSFADVAPERYRVFSDRLIALAGGYDLLLSKDTQATSIAGTLAIALRAHDDDDEPRFTLVGPKIVLPADLTLSLSLVVHELSTNATKYGALSVPEGRVSIRWTIEGEVVHFQWQETGGPPVSEVSDRGFGSVLIERAFPARAMATTRFDFRPNGLEFTLHFNTDREGMEAHSAVNNKKQFADAQDS